SNAVGKSSAGHRSNLQNDRDASGASLSRRRSRARKSRDHPGVIARSQAMTTTMIDNSQRTAAKVVGVTGLLAFALVVFGNFALLGPLLVPRDAADTARNILAHQTQFGAALTCFIAYNIGAIVLATGFYVILAPINRGLALAG